LAVGVVSFLLFFHAPLTMTEDALMEEEEEAESAESNDSTGGQKKVKAKNNKEDEDAFRDLEPPEVEEPLPDSPILITDQNWRQLDKGEWMIEFYAPWCPACRALQPRWDQLARDVKAFNEVRVRIAKCDVTDNPWLTGRMMIASLPTIFHIKEKEYRKYSGSRSSEELYDFLLKKKWRETPVLEKWREPHGAAMTAMSGFYKLANVVQSVHDMMTITYGFPVWSSYVIFGLVTLACGLSAGLVIVCCMDCLSTPTTPERRAAIIEKNRRAREERERQAKVLEEMEAKKAAKEGEEDERKPGPDVASAAGKGEEMEETLRAEIVTTTAAAATQQQRAVRGGRLAEEEEKVEEEEEEEVVRRRRGYRLLDEDEGRSTEEEDYEDSESDDDRDETETEEEEEEGEEDKKKR